MDTDMMEVDGEEYLGFPTPEGSEVPVNEAIVVEGKSGQIRNNSGGFVYCAKDKARLQRTLCLGKESNAYHSGETELSRENVDVINRSIQNGEGLKVVKTIEEFSVMNKACKMIYILYALALCCRSNNPATKEKAYRILSTVCRTPSHLFQFIKYYQDCNPNGKGWGRSLRRWVSKWYDNYRHKRGGILALAFHMTKYKARCGFTHKDVFRLCHIKTANEALGYLVCYVCQGKEKAENSRLMMNARRRVGFDQSELKKLVDLLRAFENAMNCTDEEIMVRLILQHHLVREHVPTGLLRSRKVWEALIRHMPMMAMIRNLGKMSSLGILESESFGEELTADKLVNEQLIESARIHPFTLLIAIKSYTKGTNESEDLQWEVNPRVREALEKAFYLSFKNVEVTGKRHLLAVDVSPSMNAPIMGTPNITAKFAAAAMMMVTVRRERRCDVVAFSRDERQGENSTSTQGITSISISPQDDLSTVLDTCSGIQPGRTDCSAPILDAIEKKKMYDVFVVYTDSETCFGSIHPSEALKRYRTSSGIKDARLIVCGMASNGFSIADPDDPLMLDIVGFDASAPVVIHQFVTGHF